MSNLMLIVGNGLTVDLMNCISQLENINTKNLFRNGDKVEWPDGSNEKGFLSYKHCRNLWNLGARPSMSDSEAQNLIEEIISCANTIPKNMLDDKSENIYVNAYFELVAYIKQLFIMYDKKISEKELSSDSNYDKNDISQKLNDFYTRLRSGDKATVIDDYRISMQSRTRSKSQREKRFLALKEYCLE